MTHLSIAELYEAVWKEPLTKLAGKWQVHPHALGQLLDKHNIPRPQSGFWTQKSLGKPVTIVPLPDSISCTRLIDLTNLQSMKRDKSKPYRNPLPKPKRGIKSFPLLNGIKSSFSRPIYKYDFIMTQDRRQLDVLRADISHEQRGRAINILHYLLSEMQRRGWEVSVEETKYAKRPVNTVCVDGEKIEFRLREKLKQIKRELTTKDLEDKKRYGRISHEKINVPSGELNLFIEGYFPSSVARVLKDKSNLPLEDQLGNFIDSLILTAAYIKSQKEEQRRGEIERERKDSIWRKYESLVSTQVENINDFFDGFAQWQRAEQCRQYVEAIKNSIQFQNLGSEEQSRWLKWANHLIDQLDPVSLFEMPQLIDEHTKLHAPITARALKGSKMALEASVPPISVEEIDTELQLLEGRIGV